MGIQGLLPCVKHLCKKRHIQEFQNTKVAVDGYVWLHRGAYGCSAELCQNKPTDKYIKYCMHMVNLLVHYKVIPVVVFDGARLPSKSGEESERRTKRKEALEQAQIYLQNRDYDKANECYKKAVDITPLMAHELILELKKNNIEYVVAPYEADAQLAHLARTGYVSCVITEDSDLIPYGAPRVLFKMDKYGNGTEFCLSSLGERPHSDKCLDFSKFNQDMIIRMCVLSGCDYLNSLPGIGPKTAYKIVKENKTVPKIMEALRKMGKFRNTTISLSAGSSSSFDETAAISSSQEPTMTEEEYRESFLRAELTFKHQRVYDIPTQELRNLTNLPNILQEEDVEFCGAIKSSEIIVDICTGVIDPMSHKPFAQLLQMKYSKSKTVPNSVKPSSSLNQPKISTYLTPLSKSVIQPFRAPRRYDTNNNQEKEATSTSPILTTPKQQNNNQVTTSTPSSTKKIVKSKFFQAGTPVKDEPPTTPKTPNQIATGTVFSTPHTDSSIGSSSTSNSSKDMNKKSLFQTFFSGNSQELLEYDILAPTHAHESEYHQEDLTTLLIKEDRLRQHQNQHQQTIQRKISISVQHHNSSQSSHSLPAASSSHEFEEENVLKSFESPLINNNQNLTLKRKKSSFVNKFAKTTPSPSPSSQTSTVSVNSSQSSSNSNSQVEIEQVITPKKPVIANKTKRATSSSSFVYELSDEEPETKKVKNSPVIEVISDEESDQEVDFEQEKNVFDLFLSRAKNKKVQ
ncbi:hypothetical protein ABK040_008151 [Willaertia magna]